jgi:hypothetical protein
MRKNRTKAIKKMIRDFDAGVLTSIAEVYGTAAKEMNPHQLYRAAKHIWTHKLSRTQIWGKYSLKPPEVPTAIVDEAVQDGNNIQQ